MSYGHLVVAALFFLFAYFQVNDPDPWGWVALYLGVGTVGLLSFLKQPVRWLVIPGLFVVAIWGIQLFPALIGWIEQGAPSITDQMQASQPHVELVREFFGLMLCGLVLGGYLVRNRRGTT